MTLTRCQIIQKLNLEGKMSDKVIPKELRERFGICKSVELIATKDGIILKSPDYKLIRTPNSTQDSKSVT